MIKRLIESLKHHFVPTDENGSDPHLLRIEVMAALLALIVASQAFLFSSALRSVISEAFTSASNLAAVLPSVLALETNEFRASSNVPALKESALLVAAAQMKANDMAERSYFSHIGPDGEKPWTWLRKAGYSYVYAGENLAIDFSESRSVTDAWINSPTHRENLISGNYSETGIATAEGTYEGRPTTYVVQFFASPAYSKPAPIPRSGNSVGTPAPRIASAPKATSPKASTQKPVAAKQRATSSAVVTAAAIAGTGTVARSVPGAVLGTETETRASSSASTSPAAVVASVDTVTSVKKLTPGQKVYAGLFLSPARTLVTALGLMSLLFILTVLISLAHAASRHQSPAWAERLGAAMSLHRKLALRVACFVVMLLGIAAIDSHSLQNSIQTSVSWDSTAEQQ